MFITFDKVYTWWIHIIMPRLIRSEIKTENKQVSKQEKSIDQVRKTKRVKKNNKNSFKHMIRIIKAIKANLAFRVLYTKLGSFCPDMICDLDTILHTNDALANVVKLLLQSQPFDNKTDYFFCVDHVISHLKALEIYEYHEKCKGFHSPDCVHVNIKISLGFTYVFLTIVYKLGDHVPCIIDYGFSDEFNS
jgi:hypothetical protein